MKLKRGMVYRLKRKETSNEYTITEVNDKYVTIKWRSKINGIMRVGRPNKERLEKEILIGFYTIIFTPKSNIKLYERIIN